MDALLSLAALNIGYLSARLFALAVFAQGFRQSIFTGHGVPSSLFYLNLLLQQHRRFLELFFLQFGHGGQAICLLPLELSLLDGFAGPRLALGTGHYLQRLEQSFGDVRSFFFFAPLTHVRSVLELRNSFGRPRPHVLDVNDGH